MPLDDVRQRACRELLAGAMGEESNEGESALTVGTPFGDYILEQELGRGAFGIVHLARRAGIHRYVALKEMRGAAFATYSEVQRFLQGAEAARMSEEYLQRSFTFRDYFRGARQRGLQECEAAANRASSLHEDNAYLARAHVSESDDLQETSTSATRPRANLSPYLK